MDVVFRLIKEYPEMTRSQISRVTGKSETTVKRCIEKLKSDNRIRRMDSPTYGGYWKVIDSE